MDASGAPRAPKLDGRRTHIIDRALDFVALAEQGLSAARIARRRRRSEGYVSITLRLGRAISGMEPSEIAALRSPRITWKLAQRIVRTDADVVSVRHQLRAALGGFSTHNVDGRTMRGRARGRSQGDRVRSVAWGWDAAWFDRDPLGFVEAHLRYLTGLHDGVLRRAGRTLAAQATDRPVGQSIRSLQRAIARSQIPRAASDIQAGSASPAERRAVALLSVVARKLAEAQAELGDATRALSASPARAAIPENWNDAVDDDLAD